MSCTCEDCECNKQEEYTYVDLKKALDYKFREPAFLEEFQEYIDSTYKAHYSEEDGIQTLDFIMTNSESLDFLKGNVLKYVSRYGKKEGRNKKDLFKAMHYLVLLDYYSRKKKFNEVKP